MKLALVGLLLLAVPVLAGEKTETSVAGESRENAAHVTGNFHLLSTKCEVEANEGPETTPQSPPLEVDDPGTPGCNRWEINVVADGDLTRSQNTWELPLLDINYGIGDNIQLKYEVPYLNSSADGTSSTAIGEAKAGVKLSFFENEESKTLLAVYPQFTLVSANSDAVHKGLATTGTIVTLPALLATKVGQTSAGDVNLTANLGYNLSTKADTKNFVSAAVGVGMPLSNRVGLMSELATEQAISKNADDARENLLKADLGVIGGVSKHVLLFGSVGHSLTSSDTFDHTYTLVGFRVLTGGM